MNFVNEQNNVFSCDNFGNYALETLLKFTTILSAREHRGYVDRPNFFVFERRWHIFEGYKLRQTLDNSGFAHARIAQNQRIILLAARKNLDNALDFFVTPDNRIKTLFQGFLHQIFPVAQK